MQPHFATLRGISTRSFLIATALAVAMPLISFAIYLLGHVAKLERLRVERQAIEIAHQVSETIDGELAGLLASLDGLAASSALARFDLRQFREEAHRLVVGRELIIVLRGLDETQLVNTEADFGVALPPAVPLQPSERQRFLDGQPVISGVYNSPLSGEPRIAVARPVTHEQGVYVLALTAPTSQLRDILLSKTPKGWLIGVGDEQGRYVTRSSRHDEVSGRPADMDFLAKASGSSGAFVSPNLDGVLSLAGYVRSPISRWVYAANIPHHLVTAPQRRALTLLWGFGLLTLGVSVAIAYLLSRRFASAAAQLTDQALALGAGRRLEPISTTLAEFAVVSNALRLAGAAIDERTRERERAREREALLGSVLDAADLHVGVVKIEKGAASLIVASREASDFFAAFEQQSSDGNLLLPPALSQWSALLTRASEEPEPVAAEYAIRSSSGVRHFMGTFVRLTGSGASTRVAFTASDITARHAAEEMAKARTHELETVLATVPAAVWFTYDVDARRTIRNRFAADLMRGAKVELHGDECRRPSPQCVHFYTANRPLSHNEMPLRSAMRGQEIDEQEYEFRFWDGAVRTVLMSANALRNANGKVVGAVAVALDVTERKRADDQRRLLVNELNHRVKNTLASVQSLVAQSLRGASSPGQAAKVVTERLVALAKAHDLLTRESWEGADLREVVNASIGAYSGAGRFDVSGPSVWLKPSVSLAFAMALHELITNAVKYGALSTPDGRIAIRWSPTQAGKFVSLCWSERGGPIVGPPARGGFGSRLIERSFASEDGGRAALRYDPDGVSCEIEAPTESRGHNDARDLINMA